VATEDFLNLRRCEGEADAPVLIRP
jgi:hypothetical protein